MRIDGEEIEITDLDQLLGNSTMMMKSQDNRTNKWSSQAQPLIDPVKHSKRYGKWTTTLVSETNMSDRLRLDFYI